MAQAVPSTSRKTPLAALAERWKLAALLVVLGAAAGVGAAAAVPTTYTAESRVAVGSQDLDARIVAGYSLAATQLASDIARYVNDREAVGDLAAVLGDGQAADVSHVAAAPIPSSSVIRVEVEASTAAAAESGAQAVAQGLVDRVNATTTNGPDALLARYTDITNQVTQAQQAASDAQGALGSAVASGSSAAVLDAARADVQRTAAALDVLEVQQTALGLDYRNSVTSTPAASGLSIVQDGQVSRTDRSSRMQQFGLAGAALGLLVALLLAVLLDRRRASGAGGGQATATDRADLERGSLDVSRSGEQTPSVARGA